MISLHQFYQAAEELHAHLLGRQRGDGFGHGWDAAQAFPFAGVVGHQVAAFGGQCDHIGAEHGVGQCAFDVELGADGYPDACFGHAEFWHQCFERTGHVADGGFGGVVQ